MLTMDPLKRLTAEEALEDPYFKEEPLPCGDVFNNQTIPYPKREFITDEDDKIPGQQQPQQQQQQQQQQVMNHGQDGQPQNKRGKYAGQNQYPQQGGQQMMQHPQQQMYQQQAQMKR